MTFAAFARKTSPLPHSLVVRVKKVRSKHVLKRGDNVMHSTGVPGVFHSYNSGSRFAYIRWQGFDSDLLTGLDNFEAVE